MLPFIRSFKGNRKRPRTETAEGAAAVDGKKGEKEDKDLNGESKENSVKESSKEPEKKNAEAGAKSANEGTGAAEVRADGAKGWKQFS